MVTTDDEEVAWRCRSFRDHGYDVRERLRLLEMEQKLPYIHNMVGWNYRMTEMQSAIGLAELDRMDNWNMPAPPPQRGHSAGGTGGHPANSAPPGGKRRSAATAGLCFPSRSTLTA